MRSKDEMQQVANWCEERIKCLPPFHSMIDFLHGIQRGLSWALEDIEEAWSEMEVDLKKDPSDVKGY